MPTAETPVYERFLNTYNGRELLKEHSLEETGLWQVHGEDPNCDFGGSHYNPFLGTFEGRLADVLTEVVQLDGFWQWGSGGKVEKTTVKKITPLVKTVRKFPKTNPSPASLIPLFDLIETKTKEGKIDWQVGAGVPLSFSRLLVGHAAGTDMTMELSYTDDQREGESASLVIRVGDNTTSVGTSADVLRLRQFIVNNPAKQAEAEAREILESL